MIVVTGVHRSGTSAVAMTLEALGLDFGPHDAFYGADQWNERGYFERRDVVDLNSRLLTGFPRTKGKVQPIASQLAYLLRPSVRSVERRTPRLAAEVADLAGRLDGLAVKDPRFCLTLSAWQQWVDACVVCLRHPAAVARSLQRRQHVPPRVALRFWDRHAEGLLGAPDASTLYLDFDALSGDDPGPELARAVAFLRLDVSEDDALAAHAEQFAPGLRHFAASASDELPARTAELWRALQERRGA